jgi:hypothetical protein
LLEQDLIRRAVRDHEASESQANQRVHSRPDPA